MSMEILGFDHEPLFRWTAMLGALDEFGQLSMKVGVIRDPYMVGRKLVCVRVQDFGAVFKPEEVDRLSKTMKKTKEDFPRFARQAMETVQGAADDARYASEDQRRKMI